MDRLARRRAIVISALWLVGWALLIAAAAEVLGLLWPALPGWVLPIAGAGALLVIEAIDARRVIRGQRGETK